MLPNDDVFARVKLNLKASSLSRAALETSVHSCRESHRTLHLFAGATERRFYPREVAAGAPRVVRVMRIVIAPTLSILCSFFK